MNIISEKERRKIVGNPEKSQGRIDNKSIESMSVDEIDAEVDATNVCLPERWSFYSNEEKGRHLADLRSGEIQTENSFNEEGKAEKGKKNNKTE